MDDAVIARLHVQMADEDFVTNATAAAVDVLEQRDELVQAVGRLVRALHTGQVALISQSGEPRDPADWLLEIIDGLRRLDLVIDVLSDEQDGFATGADIADAERRLRAVAKQMGALGSVRLSAGDRPDYDQGAAVAVIHGCERLAKGLAVVEPFFPLSFLALGDNRPPSVPGWAEFEAMLHGEVADRLRRPTDRPIPPELGAPRSVFNDVLATRGLPRLRRRKLGRRAKRRVRRSVWSRRSDERARSWGSDEQAFAEYDDFDDLDDVSPYGTATLPSSARRAAASLPFEAVPRSASTAPGDADPVDCTVFAPQETHPGDELLVQVFVHLVDAAEEVAATAAAFDPDTGRRGFTSLELDLPFGQQLVFHLVISGMEIEPAIQSLRWRRRTASVEFAATCPRTSEPGARIGQLTVSCDRVPVGNVRFTIKVQPRNVPSGDAGPIGDSAVRFRSAFASYASTDRAEVVKRLQMLRPLGIRFFQDVLSLDPGDRWEQKLYRYIDEADLFLLFWSSAARRSEWVHREVTYALARNSDDDAGHPAIVPIPIEGPPPVTPPDELAHLHFDDFLLYLTPVVERPTF